MYVELLKERKKIVCTHFILLEICIIQLSFFPANLVMTLQSSKRLCVFILNYYLCPIFGKENLSLGLDYMSLLCYTVRGYKYGDTDKTIRENGIF